jgi:hypothetical protein
MVARKPLQKNRCFLQKRRIDIHTIKPSLWSRERRHRKPYVRKARDLLRCDAEDFRGNVTEVAELRGAERHRLLAEAAQRLAMLLREPTSLLSALALGPRKPTDKIRRLCRRSARLGGLWGLWPRCAHDLRHSSLAVTTRYSPLPRSTATGPVLGGAVRSVTCSYDISVITFLDFFQHDRSHPRAPRGADPASP